MNNIAYKVRRKYKYNLHSNVIYETNIMVSQPKDLGLLAIDANGKLTIRKGYSWDGASYAPDIESIMRCLLYTSPSPRD